MTTTDGGRARPYSSPLRAEQAASTRQRVIDAAVSLLHDADPGVGMQEVADRAGVSVRTVYRTFPTRDDLLAGVLATIKTRFEASAGAPPKTADELRRSIGAAVNALYELEPLYRALFATPAGRESHRRSAAARHSHVEAAYADDVAGLTPQQVEQFTALMHLVTSSSGVLFLKDYGGLDRDAAAAAVSWAVDALMAAIRDPARRARLGEMQEEQR